MDDAPPLKLENPPVQSRQALEALVLEFTGPLRGFFRKRVADVSQAENLIQETFLRVVRSFHTLRSGPTVKSWIFAVASNLYRDFLRAEARSPVPGSWMDEQAAPCRDPETLVMERDLAQALTESVAALPEKHRYVFVLKHHHGLTYTEIGQVLGISEGTAKSRMHKAAIVVRERLQRRGFLGRPVRDADGAAPLVAVEGSDRG